MKPDERITLVEDELKVLKNEIKTILLDIREQYLNVQNPFNMNTGARIVNQDSGFNQPQANQPQIKEKLPNDVNTVTRIVNHDSNFEQPQMKEKLPELPTFDGDREPDVVRTCAVSRDPQYVINGEVPLKNELKISKFNLVAIAGLSQWVDQSTEKLGKERAEALVEISCTMGQLPSNVKDTLIKMVRLSHHSSNGQIISAGDYLSTLTQLDSLLGNPQLQDSALLSILSMIKESKGG